MGERDNLHEPILYGEILPPEPEVDQTRVLVIITGIGGSVYVGRMTSQALQILVNEAHAEHLDPEAEHYDDNGIGIMTPRMPQELASDRFDEMMRKVQRNLDEAILRKEEHPRVVLNDTFVSVREQEKNWGHDRFGRKHRGRTRK